MIYIAWFYAFGVGLNLGDTASYIEESSAATYFERGDGVGFAYVATLIYSNPVSRILVEALTILVISSLLVELKTDRQAVVASVLLLLPTSLAFMTVASKELLVFLLLCSVYRMRLWFGLPAYGLTVALKPSFAVIALLPVARRLSFVALYILFTIAVAAVLLPIGRWTELYDSFFRENLAHFSAGNLTYGDGGAFPFAPLLRVIGLDLGGMELYGVVIGLMVLAANMILFLVLTSRYGAFSGGVMFLVFAVAVAPYSVHNLGSAARYQAPLVCALVLNELLVNARQKKAEGVKWAL
ncbi:hypothetical protein G6024_04905 [Dietzia maris]|nr:hypothetical protein [Dietzia maris]MBB0996446.1 hypothetical protein [Dietzia maris]